MQVGRAERCRRRRPQGTRRRRAVRAVAHHAATGRDRRRVRRAPPDGQRRRRASRSQPATSRSTTCAKYLVDSCSTSRPAQPDRRDAGKDVRRRARERHRRPAAPGVRQHKDRSTCPSGKDVVAHPGRRRRPTATRSRTSSRAAPSFADAREHEVDRHRSGAAGGSSGCLGAERVRRRVPAGAPTRRRSTRRRPGEDAVRLPPDPRDGTGPGFEIRAARAAGREPGAAADARPAQPTRHERDQQAHRDDGRDGRPAYGTWKHDQRSAAGRRRAEAPTPRATREPTTTTTTVARPSPGG